MSEGKKRRVHTAEFKAKVGLEPVCGVKTVTEIAQEFNVHPMLVGQWKKEIPENAGALFDDKRGPKPIDESSPEDKLYSEIERLKMEVDWLKKSWDPESRVASGIEPEHAKLPLTRPMRVGRRAPVERLSVNGCSDPAGARDRGRSEVADTDR